MLCCAITNLVFKIKVHTRGQADHNEGVEDGTDALPKLDQLTLKMCEDLEGSGATVNMDNYYMSATTPITFFCGSRGDNTTWGTKFPGR